MKRQNHYRYEIVSRLENGFLPIIHSRQIEPSMEYSLIMFVTTDTGEMAVNPPKGTHWQAAYMSTMGCMYSEEQKDKLNELYKAELENRQDIPVICLRITARNMGNFPGYAYYRTPTYKPNSLPPMYPPYDEINENLHLDS